MIAAVPQMNDTAVAGRLHHRVPGRAREVRLRGRLRDDAPAARAREPDRGGSRDRLLRHDRVAGEERAGEQRPRRHDRRLVRGLHDRHVDGASASGAESRGAVRADGRRLDGRRLVPQRRVPPARRARVHLRPGSGAQGRPQVVVRRVRRVRHVPARRLGRRAGAGARSRSARLLARARRAHELRLVVADTRRSTSCSRRSRSRCR